MQDAWRLCSDQKLVARHPGENTLTGDQSTAVRTVDLVPMIDRVERRGLVHCTQSKLRAGGANSEIRLSNR